MRKSIVRGLFLGVAALILAACGQSPAGEVGTEIISAEEAIELLRSEDNVVLVDAQTLLNYRDAHIEGAVNISRADIVVNSPFPNLVAPAEEIEEVMGSRGIANDTLVIAYDNNNNMDAARLWWTLKAYGHDLVKVVSGGLQALTDAGASVSTSAPSVTQATFRAEPIDTSMLASTSEIRDWINNPDPNVCLIDTRMEEEYNLEGTIPGSILLDYAGNNFPDGEYRPPRHIRIRYLEAGVDFDDTPILYCKTSIRGAQTYLAMYNAGYRGMKLYDGAWVEWTANPMNPVFVPETTQIPLEASDGS